MFGKVLCYLGHHDYVKFDLLVMESGTIKGHCCGRCQEVAPEQRQLAAEIAAARKEPFDGKARGPIGVT